MANDIGLGHLNDIRLEGVSVDYENVCVQSLDVCVPRFIVDAFDVFNKDTVAEGIFRKEGRRERRRNYPLRTHLFLHGWPRDHVELTAHNTPNASLADFQEFVSALTIHDVACLIKEFFRQIDNPLIVHELQPSMLAFIERYDNRNPGVVMKWRPQDPLIDLCHLLPPIRRDLLVFTMNRLKELADTYEDMTKMTYSNLATVLTPSLLRAEDSPEASTSQKISTHYRRIELVEMLIRSAPRIGQMTEEEKVLCTGMGSPYGFDEQSLIQEKARQNLLNLAPKHEPVAHNLTPVRHKESSTQGIKSSSNRASKKGSSTKKWVRGFKRRFIAPSPADVQVTEKPSSPPYGPPKSTLATPQMQMKLKKRKSMPSSSYISPLLCSSPEDSEPKVAKTKKTSKSLEVLDKSEEDEGRMNTKFQRLKRWTQNQRSRSSERGWKTAKAAIPTRQELIASGAIPNQISSDQSRDSSRDTPPSSGGSSRSQRTAPLSRKGLPPPVGGFTSKNGANGAMATKSREKNEHAKSHVSTVTVHVEEKKSEAQDLPSKKRDSNALKPPSGYRANESKRRKSSQMSLPSKSSVERKNKHLYLQKEHPAGHSDSQLAQGSPRVHQRTGRATVPNGSIRSRRCQSSPRKQLKRGKPNTVQTGLRSSPRRKLDAILAQASAHADGDEVVKGTGGKGVARAKSIPNDAILRRTIVPMFRQDDSISRKDGEPIRSKESANQSSPQSSQNWSIPGSDKDGLPKSFKCTEEVLRNIREDTSLQPMVELPKSIMLTSSPQNPQSPPDASVVSEKSLPPPPRQRPKDRPIPRPSSIPTGDFECSDEMKALILDNQSPESLAKASEQKFWTGQGKPCNRSVSCLQGDVGDRGARTVFGSRPSIAYIASQKRGNVMDKVAKFDVLASHTDRGSYVPKDSTHNYHPGDQTKPINQSDVQSEEEICVGEKSVALGVRTLRLDSTTMDEDRDEGWNEDGDINSSAEKTSSSSKLRLLHRDSDIIRRSASSTNTRKTLKRLRSASRSGASRGRLSERLMNDPAKLKLCMEENTCMNLLSPVVAIPRLLLK